MSDLEEIQRLKEVLAQLCNIVLSDALDRDISWHEDYDILKEFRDEMKEEAKSPQVPEQREVEPRRFSYRIIWSEEDQEWVGLCDQYPSLSWLARYASGALSGIQDLVAQELNSASQPDPSNPQAGKKESE